MDTTVFRVFEKLSEDARARREWACERFGRYEEDGAEREPPKVARAHFLLTLRRTQVFVAATVARWRSLGGIVALCALCAGDGLAEVAGRSRLGRRGPRIPWCRRKSIAGSCAFFAATLAAGVAFALKLGGLGWWAPVPTPRLVAGVAAVAAAAALAESFETGPWDNPLIFAAAAVAAEAALPH